MIRFPAEPLHNLQWRTGTSSRTLRKRGIEFRADRRWYKETTVERAFCAMGYLPWEIYPIEWWQIELTPETPEQIAHETALIRARREQEAVA